MQYVNHLVQIGRVVGQAGISFEVVLVINDATLFERQTISELSSTVNNSFQVRALFVEREPLYASWNRGVEASSGKCIGFWNVDDVRAAEAIIEGYQRILTGCRLIDFPYSLVQTKQFLRGIHREKAISYKPFPYDVEGNNPLDRIRTGPFFMFARSLYDQVGPFDPRFKIVGDFEWNVRAASITSFCRGQAYAGRYVIHGGNLSAGNLLPVEENVVIMLFPGAHQWEGLRPVPPDLMRSTWEQWNSSRIPPDVQEFLWGKTGKQIYLVQQSSYPWIPAPLRGVLSSSIDRVGLRPFFARIGLMKPGRGFQIMSHQARHPWVPEAIRLPLRKLVNRSGARNTLARLGLVRSQEELRILPSPSSIEKPILSYVDNGRIPWSRGYLEYRQQFVEQTLRDKRLMHSFRERQSLPDGYGIRMDERVVEYPWLFTRLHDAPTLLLDAGSTLNQHFLLSKSLLLQKTVIIYTLAPESVQNSPNISYVYGDLRNTVLRDAIFDEIACISTLEHVGMDNTMLYTLDNQYNEALQDAYLQVIREFSRLLKPGGQLLLTVPYGKVQNLGWLQQFDKTQLESVITGFDGEFVEQTYYRYGVSGWQISSAEECDDCEYYDVHSGKPFDSDYAAAARSVACLVLVKS
jgi:hypothetical protein